MGVIEMGWYANSFSISFDYNKRKDSTYLKKIRNQIIDGITGCIKHNGLYSDSGAIMPKMDTSYIFESKEEAENYIHKVIENKGYDYSIAVPYNDFTEAGGEFERLVQEMNDIEIKRQELTKSASDAVMSKQFITCRKCGHKQAVGTLDRFKCIFCDADVRSVTKLNQRKALFNKWIRLNKKKNEMRNNKKYIYLLVRFAFHC